MRQIFQVFTTHRNGLSNHCIAVRTSFEQAQLAIQQFSQVLKNESIRCYIVKTNMTDADILNVVRQWGYDDSISGFSPRDELKNWGSEFVAAYLQGFNSPKK